VNDTDVLARIQEAFGGLPRPEHFTDYRHCCECAEHDELLRSHDPATLTIDDVGNPGWDPLCHISAEGFRYFMPALAGLALDPPRSAAGWYLPQLLFHLNYQGSENRHLLAASSRQREAVVQLLLYIGESRGELVREYGEAEELALTIALWADSGQEISRE
jgi:hypothetical protein